MSVSPFRYVPLSVHSGLETIAAPLIMAGPLLLGLDQAAIVAGFALGTLLLGLTLSLFSERRVVPLTTHAEFDYVLAFAAVVIGSAIGIATGDAAAMIFLVGVGVAQAALTASTRFSAARVV
ncbi:MAG: hypothetical protein ACRDL3_08875 [Solirubrobacterales bacterium]